MRKTELVVLQITYDDQEHDSPRQWNWDLMCELPSDDVTLLPALPTPEQYFGGEVT